MKFIDKCFIIKCICSSIIAAYNRRRCSNHNSSFWESNQHTTVSILQFISVNDCCHLFIYVIFMYILIYIYHPGQLAVACLQNKLMRSWKQNLKYNSLQSGLVVGIQTPVTMFLKPYDHEINYAYGLLVTPAWTSPWGIDILYILCSVSSKIFQVFLYMVRVLKVRMSY